MECLASGERGSGADRCPPRGLALLPADCTRQRRGCWCTAARTLSGGPPDLHRPSPLIQPLLPLSHSITHTLPSLMPCLPRSLSAAPPPGTPWRS